MICRTIEEMQRVAIAGAAKMFRQGYSYERDTTIPGAYWLYVPEAFVQEGGRDRYFVTLSPQSCDCPFCTNHADFVFDSTCKHIEYVRAEEESIAAYESYEEAREEARIWEGYGDLRYSLGGSHAWPTCAVCGHAHEAAESGGPMAGCDWCQRHQ